MADAGLLTGDLLVPLPRIDARVRQAMHVLIGAGAVQGSAIALLLRNGPAFIEASLAAQNLGAYAVPINWHFAPPEISYVLSDCGAGVLLAEPDLLALIADAIPQNVRVYVTGATAAASHALGWEAAIASAPCDPLEKQPPAESMIYTSGTTGNPKGVRRSPATGEQAVAIAAMRQRIYDSTAGMRALLAAPLYHSAPNYFALSTLRAGGLLVLQDKFDAEATLGAIAAHRITHMFMVPTMFVRLLALPQAVRERYDMSSLRWVLHAGAPCPAHVKAAMIDWWGPVLTEYYGSTELGPLTFCDSAEWLAHRGTVGRALAGVEFSVRDEKGAICAPGVAGEICVTRTPQTDFTYHGNADKRSAMESAAGLASGDIGYLDPDGYLHLCDRKTDMVISGGVNIYPAEVEAALMTLDGVADCAVLGMPDPEFGEQVVAFVQLAPAVQFDAHDLQARLRERIAGYKVPRAIYVRDVLPRDDSGKIFKRKLRATLVPSAAPAPASGG